MFKKIILPFWILISISLLLYSYTQVDLSLTLSQVSIWQGIQKSFQYVGYFNRPLSAVLYVSILTILFSLYGLTLYLVKKELISREDIVKIIISVVVILFFSYNAFSYDLFNYIFDAKIFTHYGQNPYDYRALDFPTDPMLSFMHWTHRTYPYGPVWLLISIPLSYAGFGIFLLTFFLFKSVAVISYLASVFLIEKIAKKMELNTLFVVTAFALNPLVLVESLVSAHNDIVMLALALVGILFYLERKLIKSFVFILASILLKYASVLVIPAIILRGLFRVSKNIFFYALIISMIIAVLLATARTNFQPWYLLYVITFAAFMARKFFILIPLMLVSVAGLLQYVPYIYLGNWNPPVPDVLNNIMYASLGLSAILVLIYYFINRRRA